MSTKFIQLESIDILSKIPSYHIILQGFIFLWVAWFISKRRQRENRQQPSEEEVQRKLTEWRPEPLVPQNSKDHPSLTPRSVTSLVGKRVTIDGNNCLNLATHNYLGLVGNNEIQEKAMATIQKYGVGSCGPRGFYGTVDVHLELEERLAKFMNMEEAVVYSYGFSTIASAIPAFCKRKDLVFVDEMVNFSIQKGLDASRSNVKYFKHNDVNDLKNLLLEQEKIDKKNPKKAANTRRFLIVEGIYMNTGCICPLPEFVALCKKYKLRIFIDESISFGTLGIHGRGVTEYFNVPKEDIDMIMASLEWSIGSIGGFCVGSSFVIEHHRLSGLGYCFSASLPPLLTTAAITSLDIMERNLEIFKQLKRNCLSLVDGLNEIEYFDCTSFKESPVKHLYLKEKRNLADEMKILNEISKKCIDSNLAIIMPAYLEAEIKMPRPSLRICVSSTLNQEDIQFTLKTLKNCSAQVLGFYN
ncbi:serine palmitoyltransferase 1 [Leptopilina boulardi]|uniref:serine palmitoyltransferase 1 n=1 Tax=Leptopilina boulardi TaxID=63433 RepID=UPI0021F60DCB|nr:serine palmitoyltransferase 1 [Leptopilina boulardi]